MTTTTCPRCRKSIDARAEICPYCKLTLFGDSNNNNTLYAVLAFIIVCVIVYLNMQPKEQAHDWNCWYSESANGQVCFDK